MFVVGIRTIRARLVVSEFRDALREVGRPRRTLDDRHGCSCCG